MHWHSTPRQPPPRPCGSHREKGTEMNTEAAARSGTTEHHGPGHKKDPNEAFGSDIGGLPGSVPTPTVELSDGAVFDLRVAPVTKQIGGATVRMLAYNGSIPGPTLRVRQG